MTQKYDNTDLSGLLATKAEYIVFHTDQVVDVETLHDAITHQLQHGGIIYGRLRTGNETRDEATAETGAGAA